MVIKQLFDETDIGDDPGLPLHSVTGSSEFFIFSPHIPVAKLCK